MQYNTQKNVCQLSQACRIAIHQPKITLYKITYTPIFIGDIRLDIPYINFLSPSKPLLTNSCATPYHDTCVYHTKRDKRNQIFKKNGGFHHGRRGDRQVISQLKQIQNQNIRIRNPCLQTKTNHGIYGICAHHNYTL